MKRTYSLRKYGKQLVAVALASVALGMAGTANADSWTANTPDQIEIVPGQSSYTLKAGDTLWAVSQKLNLTVDFLAEVNGINLNLGEERNLPVGRVISWSVVAGQEVVQVDGVNYPVADVDKIDSADAVGVQQVVLLPDKAVEGTPSGTYTAIVLPFKPQHDETVKNDKKTVDKKSDGVTEVVKDTVVPTVVEQIQPIAPDVQISKIVYDSSMDFLTENNVRSVMILGQNDLDAYLTRTGFDLSGDRVFFDLKEDVTFNKGVYAISDTVYWYFPKSTTSKIDFNGSVFAIGNNANFDWEFAGSHDLTLKNATIYGSVSEKTDLETGKYVTTSGSRSRAGAFTAKLVHVDGVTFEGLEINNAHISDGHIVDIIGSTNVTINNVKIAGYGGEELNQDAVNARYKASIHSVNSESIQIDASVDGALGRELKGTTLWNDEEFDGRPSTGITIQNSAFTPYEGQSGQGIIDGTGEEVVRSVSATIGSHSVGNSGYQDIVITDNVFDSTIAVDGSSKRVVYPIHMKNGSTTYVADSDTVRATTSNIVVENNTFVNQTGDYQNNGVVDGNNYVGWYGEPEGEANVNNNVLKEN